MLSVKIRRLVDCVSTQGPKSFMYEGKLRRDESYEETVCAGWRASAGIEGLGGLNDALMQMQNHLGEWSVKIWGREEEN
jgi:hypothetical protein